MTTDQPLEEQDGESASATGGLSESRGPTTALLGLTLLLTSVNLRAAATSVGPVLNEIQLELGMSDAVAGVLTTLPVASFGLIGLFTARLGRRVGTDRALIGALVVIVLGLVIRAMAPTTPLLLVTSLLALSGMAVGNVMVPVVVKAWFDKDIGRWTGLYSMSVVIGTSVPLAVTVPIADFLGGWRYGLGVWAIPAFIALVPWLFVVRRSRGIPPPPTSPAGPSTVNRKLRAWALMAYFGIQSLEAYVAMGWLPTIFRDAGITPTRAGLYTGITLAMSVVAAIVVPRFAARSPSQRPWVLTLSVFTISGYSGLWLAPAAAPLLWSVVLGLGLGAFPLALLLIGIRSRTSRSTRDLSSLVQGWGYLVAATGPVTIGVLYQVTGGWHVPLLSLLLLIIPKTTAGLIAAGPGFIDDEEPARAAEPDPPDSPVTVEANDPER